MIGLSTLAARGWLLACGLVVTSMAPVAAQSPTREIRVLAAGSLRAALTDAAAAFEAADVFASASMEHPQALAATGRARPVQRFARHAMCMLVRPGLEVGPDTLVRRLLDPALELGVSTPRSHPAGDFAVQVFERIERSGIAGAAGTLSAKAPQLTGGPQPPPPPPDHSVYGMLVAQGAADLFLTHCTNAVVAMREQPGQRSVPVPDALNVSASYGISLIQGDGDDAQRFVDFVLAPAGQTVLARHGFSAP